MKKAVCFALVVLMFFALCFTASARQTGETAPQNGDVLYEYDFSNGLPDDFRFPDGHKDKVYVEDGFLYIDAVGREFTRVFLPDTLDGYGDYEITVHATILKQRDTGRWGSIIYRAQNVNYPYYQMCFRYDSNAANGVEFALRNEQDQWNVTSKGSVSGHVFSADTLDEIKVTVRGERAIHSINGTAGVDCDDAAVYEKGGIGLQANYCILKVDDIKVTYLSPAESSSLPQYTDIAQSDLGVIGGYTLSEYIESKEQLYGLVSKNAIPANAIFRINKDLQAISKYGEVICTVDEALSALDGKIMPTFKISDEESCDAVCGFLSANAIKDVFIMSEKDELVLRARKAYRTCRGVLDLTNGFKGKIAVSEDELLEIRGRTNAALASVVVLPETVASTQSVKYLYDRLVAVWVCAASEMNTAAHAFNIAAAGGHGAITDNTAMMYDVIENYMSGNKLFRVPLNIGHRGIPTQAPENTVEGSLKAYELGADCIENDIYITKDGEIAVMHDATTDRTTNGKLSMESSTLAELKELLVNKQYPNKKEYANARIPSLQDYYEALKGKDVQIFVEIKSTDKKIVDKFRELTEAYGTADQVSVITFHENQIKNLTEVFPEMSAGYLCGALGSDADGAKQAISVLGTTQRIGSTYNPSYPGHNAEFAKNANMRGLTVWPWTVDDKGVYIELFMSGYNGITTNNCRIPAKWAKKLSTKKYEYEIFYGETHKVTAELMNYKREISDVSADVRVIPLSEGITVGENNVLSFPAEGGGGKYYYALEYTYKINSSSSYTLHTQPILAVVSDPPSTEPVTAEEQATENVTEEPGEKDTDNKTNYLWIIPVAVVAAAVVAAVILVIIKKKK